MSEIRNENKKVALPRVNMYLGKNKKGDIIAFPAGSLIVSGRLGSGMNTFYNNLLLSFVENCKPDTYNLHLWSDYECSVWYDAFDSKHRLTSFKEINYAFEGKACEKSLVHFICTACDEIKRREALQESDLLTREFYVIDLSNPNLWDNFYDTTQEGICNILCMYISRGDSVGVHFILTTQLSIPESRLPKLFTYRASLRNYEESSRQVLGSDIAYTDDSAKHGVIWVKSDYDDVPAKLWYTFRPNTFIKKIIKAFGVSSEWSEEEIRTLKSLYPERGVEASKFLDDRSEIDCLRKAHELGLDLATVDIQRNPAVSWTEEEDAILKKNYPTMGYSVVRLLTGRSVSACRNRADKLGVKYIRPEDDSVVHALVQQLKTDSSLTNKQREYIQEVIQRHLKEV